MMISDYMTWLEWIQGIRSSRNKLQTNGGHCVTTVCDPLPVYDKEFRFQKIYDIDAFFCE